MLRAIVAMRDHKHSPIIDAGHVHDSGSSGVHFNSRRLIFNSVVGFVPVSSIIIGRRSSEGIKLGPILIGSLLNGE